jgi:hypothetical protein
LLPFLFFSSILIYGEDFISRYTSYLGRPLPNEFKRISETIYENNDVILHIENKIVISSAWTEEYKSDTEANFYYNMYCNYFENIGWTLFQSDLHASVYKFNNIYVVCSNAELRIDGLFTIMIIFYLGKYYDSLIIEKGIGG